MDPRDRTVIINLTDEIRSLTKVINDNNKLSNLSESFHKRQVPALQRQTEALDYIRDQRQILVNTSATTTDKSIVLKIIDMISELLLSS